MNRYYKNPYQIDIGILAFIEYYKRGNVDIKAGMIIAIALILGSAVASRFVQDIPPRLKKEVHKFQY